jgi:hypothetical protein
MLARKQLLMVRLCFWSGTQFKIRSEIESEKEESKISIIIVVKYQEVSIISEPSL